MSNEEEHHHKLGLRADFLLKESDRSLAANLDTDPLRDIVMQDVQTGCCSCLRGHLEDSGLNRDLMLMRMSLMLLLRSMDAVMQRTGDKHLATGTLRRMLREAVGDSMEHLSKDDFDDLMRNINTN